MAFTEHRTSAPIIIPAPQDVLRKVARWVRRQQKRNEVAQLLNKEDWLLQDMGITRGDVREALAQRADPSLHLRALAARRRFWLRQASKR